MSEKRADLAPARILLIDPDPGTRLMLAQTLRLWDHQVVLGDESALDERSLTARSELLLLDPNGPGSRAWQRLRALRERSRVPVIAMLAGDDSLDRVLALESGADAIMAKPLDLRELRARMVGLLGRTVEPAAGSQQFGRWRLDAVTRRLSGPGGFSTPLSPAEYRLLRAFLERPQSILRREELLELANSARQAGGTEMLERGVDLLISRLRHKLDDDARKPQLIRTVRGIGYLFDDSLR